MKSPKTMPDGPWDSGGGIVIERRFSVSHLQFQNPLAQATDDELRLLLQERIRTMPTDPNREGPFCIAVDLLEDGVAAVPPRPVAQIIHQGNLYGMGASPLVPIEANLLWAAAARLLRRAQVQHVNDLAPA